MYDIFDCFDKLMYLQTSKRSSGF